MRRAGVLGALLVAGWSFLLGGCGSNAATRDYNLLFTNMDSLEYAEILCSGIDMEDRHTCLTSVIEYHDEMIGRDVTPKQVLDGPFVVVLDDDLYRGSYVSQPFASAFTVSNGVNVCRGRYNAFAGDTEAVFKVICDDGSRGRANIMLDAEGRNGVGEIQMDDGALGKIVFGHAVVGGAFL
ncbi:MAG: hypothetical protein WBG92_20740 [Thiohalocapsa sp.]